MTIAELLDALWRDYVATTPQAERIHRLLAERGEHVRNDHVALRTYDHSGIAALAAPFEALGWQRRDRYRFDDKHLVAFYWQHADPALPKIFISELCTNELSPAAQRIIANLVGQLPPDFVPLPWSGRPWRVSRADYEALLAESEYAAWVAAFGFRVNHFTVDANHLATFGDLSALNAFLVANGFVLNDAGGAIKGTRAEPIDVELADATLAIPSCYYEFAKRYPLPSGELFHGFVPASADKIFESTDTKR